MTAAFWQALNVGVFRIINAPRHISQGTPKLAIDEVGYASEEHAYQGWKNKDICQVVKFYFVLSTVEQSSNNYPDKPAME